MTYTQPQQIIQAIYAAAQALDEKKEDINRLNVFPVPDGDTGTNMSLTLSTVVSELSALSHEAERAEVLKAITHGSLMGARGNSGVILSQILRGICEGLETASAFDAERIALAANRSVEVAFNAVRKPVEGTILTVLKDSAVAAAAAVEQSLSAEETLRAIALEAMASVRRTPELLPVLKENGVVDAGGFGLAILLESFSAAINGEATAIPTAASLSAPEPKVAIEQVNDWEGSAYLYCTEFLLTAEGLSEGETLDFLASRGDCELLVGSAPDYKVHVHTNEPGTVLNYMTERGQISEVHIHNMYLQSASRAEHLSHEGAGSMSGSGHASTTISTINMEVAAASPSEAESLPQSEIGFIAVASGSGTARILESLGVNYVVQGGQTMNPSTKDFVDAIEAVNANSVIIFPNNKNIIMAAQVAAENASKPALVVPTTSVPQAFTALFLADTEASLEENVQAMCEAAASVTTAEITVAIKEAKAADGSPIAAGDVIGITPKGIEVVGNEISEVALRLVELIATDADVLTLLAGRDFGDVRLQALAERVKESWPALEVDSQRGDQPLYPLILAAE